MDEVNSKPLEQKVEKNWIKWLPKVAGSVKDIEEALERLGHEPKDAAELQAEIHKARLLAEKATNAADFATYGLNYHSTTETTQTSASSSTTSTSQASKM